MNPIIADGTIFSATATGRDSSALVIGTQEFGSRLTRCQVNANGANWGIKMPGNRDSVFEDSTFTGGTERALDAVRGGNLTWNRCKFSAGSDRRVTPTRFWPFKTCDIGLKGGLTGFAFNDCEFADMLLGDFSIYNEDRNLPKTSGGVLTNCVHPKGAHVPIIIRCLAADVPRLVNTNAVILVVPELFVKAYFWECCHFGDTRQPVAAA